MLKCTRRLTRIVNRRANDFQRHDRRPGVGCRLRAFYHTQDSTRLPNRFLMPSDDWAGWGESEWLDWFFDLREDYGSIRGVSRATGVAYSTLQGIFSGRVAEPSQRTRERIENALQAAPVIREGRRRTVVDDSLFWTNNKLANLVPPPGAVAFQMIGRPGSNPSGRAFSKYMDLNSHLPSDFLSEPGFDVRALGRIVWAYPRGR